MRKAKNGAPMRWIETVALLWASDNCLPFPFALTKGYGTIWVDGEKWIATRYICTRIYGPPADPKLNAAHECGNSICVNHRHLKWKTYAENEADKFRHGTRGFGEDAPGSKLTDQEVIAIRAMSGTHTSIALRFGVSRRLIGMIKQRHIWAHLPDREAA